MTNVSERPAQSAIKIATAAKDNNCPPQVQLIVFEAENPMCRPDNVMFTRRRKPKTGFDRVKNLLTLIGATIAAIWIAKKISPNFVKSIGSALERAGQSLKGTFKQAKTKVKEAAETAKDTVKKTAEKVAEKVEAAAAKTPREKAMEKAEKQVQETLDKAYQARLDKEAMVEYLEKNPMKAKVAGKIHRAKFWRRVGKNILKALRPDKLFKRGQKAATKLATGGLA